MDGLNICFNKIKKRREEKIGTQMAYQRAFSGHYILPLIFSCLSFASYHRHPSPATPAAVFFIPSNLPIVFIPPSPSFSFLVLYSFSPSLTPSK
jgi:hypothetical protein